MPKGRCDLKKFRQFIHEYYRVKFLSVEYKKKREYQHLCYNGFDENLKYRRWRHSHEKQYSIFNGKAVQRFGRSR